MLREYRLTNFKAFGETVTIPIRPLTLIFGANSSGKSSIFQSLLLLKQTLEEAKSPDTALLPKGSLADLGTYRDFVHRHETERDFEFEARFDLNNPLILSPRKTVGEAGLDIRFSYIKEYRSALLSRGNVTVGGERQPIASYPLDKILEGESAIRFHYEIEFWQSWWNALHRCYESSSSSKYKDLAFLISENFEIPERTAEEWAKDSIPMDRIKTENSEDFDSKRSQKYWRSRMTMQARCTKPR